MANDLKILITGSLNIGKSIGEINSAISGLEKKVKSLKVNVEINDKVLSTLNNFNKQFSKISSVARDTGKVIQEVLNPDGSKTKTTYFNGLKGEFSQITTAAKQSAKEQVTSLEEVSKEFAKVTKEAEKFNAAQKKIGATTNLSNETGTVKRTVNTNADGNVTGYKDTYDYAKDSKLTQQLVTDKQKLRQELVKLGETGNVTAQQLANVARSINGAKDTSGIQQAQASFAQLQSQAKLAEQMAQGREKAEINRQQAENKANVAQAQAINRNNELARQEIQQGIELEAEIKRRIDLYQREKQVQATNLQAKYGSSINQSALNSQLSSVMTVNPNQFKSLEELKNWQQQANVGFKELTAGMQDASHNATSFGEALKTAFSRLGLMMGVSTIIYQAISAISNGIKTVNELNQSLTEVSIVTGQNQEQVSKLGESYNKLAQNMGVTTVELSKTAASLYRQGLSQDEVVQRMKTITEYAKISSLDVSSATEIMTAAINSMGVSAKRASDVWSYLGDATATGADEIGRAMQKVGGTAGALDVNFEKVSSWIAVISSRTRESAETIGQSVKSMMARIQSMKENGFDETDGTKVNQVAKALNAVGVQLMDSQGQFRNFGNVMDELGSKWKNLDSRQKAYVATTVAGTYQQSRFLNLMEGYGDSVNLYKKALDSAGTSQKKFDLYQQGTEAKLNKLKAALESVWMGMFDSKGIQAVISSFTSLTTSIKSIVDHVGALAPVLGVAGVAILAFNGGLKSIMTNGALTLTVLKGIPTGLTRMDSSLAASTLKTRLLGSAVSGIGMSLRGLKVAFASTATFMAGAILPMAAFMALGFAIQKVTEALQKQREEERKLKAEQDSITKSYSSHSTQINKLASDYESMNEKVKNNQMDKSSKEYTSTMNELGKLMPSLVKSTDEHGNSILRSVTAVKEELKYAEQLKENYAQMSVANFEKDLDTQSSKVEDILQKIENYKRNASGADQSPIVKAKGIVTVDEGTKLYDQRQVIAQERELKLLLASSTSYMKDKAKAMMDVEGVTDNLSKSQKKLVDTYISQAVANKKNIKDGEDFKKFLSETTNNAVNLAENLTKIPSKLKGVFSNKEIIKFSKDQVAVMSSIQDSVKSGYTAWYSYHGALSKVGFTSDQVKEIIKNLIKVTSEQKDKTKSAADAQKEYADNLKQTIEAEMEKATIEEQIVGTTQSRIDQTKDQITAYQLLSNLENLSVDQKLALADATKYLNSLYPQFIKNGKLNVEQMRREAEAEDILLKAVNDVATGHASAEEMMTLNQAQQARNRLEILSAEMTGMQKLMDTYASAAKHQEDMAKATGDDRAYIQAQKFHNAQQQASNDYDTAKKAIDALIPSYDKQVQKLADATDYQGQYYRAADKSNDKSKDAIYVTDKYKQALEAVNAQISQLENSQKKYATDSAQYRSALQKEIDLQTQKLKLMQDQEKSLASQIKSGKIVQTGMVSDTSNSTPASPSSGSYNWNSLGGKLAGSGSLMEKYGNKYGISPALLAAIAMHETGNGTSSAVRNKNNAFGIMGSNGLKSFTSLEESIKYAASLLKKNYIDKGLTTVEAIQKKYAPVGVANDPTGLNKNWVNGVNKFISLVSGATKSVTSNNSSSGGISALIAEARRQSNLGTFTYQQIGGDFKGTYQQFLNRALSDCSQFVQEYFQNFLNTNVPRTAAEQWKAGQSVAKGQQQIGDLVFWNTTGKAHSHVGIYTGNGKVMQMGTKGLKEIDVSDIKGFEGYRRIAGASSASSPNTSPSSGDAAQAVDQAKSDLLGLQTDIQSTADLIKQLQEEIVQSKIDQVVNSNENLLNYVDGVIQKSQLLQQQFKEGSTQWTKAMSDQIIYQKKKIQITNDEIAGLQNLLKTEKLSAAQKAEVNQKIQELTLSQLDYLNTIDQIYDKERDVQTQAKVDAVQKLYDGEIKKLQDKLDKLDEVEKAEERITQQKELQDQIDKAKSDKSHQYIDSNGNVQLTYDKGAVADLEKQMSDLKDGWAKEDAKQSLQDQIAALETKRDDSIAKLQKLNEDYQTKMFKNTTDLTNTMNQFVKDLGFIFGTAVKLPKHHTGGTVGSQSSSLGNLFNKLFNVGNNEQVIKALKGEVVINPNLPKVQNNFKNLIDIMSSGRQTGTVDQSKNITIQKIEIKANNPMEFFQGLDNVLRSV
jgi:TP901 family phage tail tape measure protein